MSHLHHKVSALVDGELSSAARSRALAHARACPQCRQEIAETMEVKRRLHKLAPVELSDDLVHAVAYVAPTRPLPVGTDRAPILRLVAFGAGSLSAVVIVLAYVVGAPAPPQAKPVTPSVEEFAAEFAGSTGRSPLSDPVVEAVARDPSAGVTSPIDFGAGDGTAKLPTPAPYPAGVTPYDARQTRDSGAALRLLRKAVLASRRVAYVGVRVVRALTPSGVQSSAVQVRHVPGQGTRFDAGESTGSSGTGGGSEGRWFVADAAADGAAAHPVSRLAGAYDLHMDGSQMIDGRATSVVSASQDGAVAARFWIDDHTGLLLRKAMYVDGELVRWSGYTSIDLTPQAFMEHLPPQLRTAASTTLSTSIAPALNDKGWTCPQWLTKDFKLLALRQVDADGGVIHAEYTDGLSSVSVFEERGALDASSLAGFRLETLAGRPVYVGEGLPMIVVWQAGDLVMTMVTDAPEQVARQLLARFPHGASQGPPSLPSRIGHGLSRIASAVSP